jgi:tetratricopeptide (TPR) repeat protein
MHKIYILLTTLCLAILPVLSSAQSRNQEAAAENDIISAVALYNERNFDGAKAILDRLRVDSPSNDAAWYWSALVCLGKNDIPAAEEYLKVACDLDPSNFWYRFRLATLYRVTSRQELTVDMYEKLLADFPKKSDLYFDLVDMYTAQGETEKALETLKEIETVFGMTESIAMFRFNLLQQSGRQEEAFASLEEYNKKYSSPYVLTTLGDYQMNMYNDSTALAYYNEALDIAPDYIPAVIGKAETFRVTRRYDEYFTALDKLITSDDAPAAGKSDYLMAIVQRTDPKFLKSFMPQMDKVMETMTEKYPQDSTVLQMAGVYYWTTERRDISKKHFRQNVENNPGSIMATADFVEFLMYAEDWKALSEEGRRAFERFPDETTFLEMASVGDYNLQEFDKVLEICDKVLEVAPNDSSKTLRAWSTIGDIWHQKGDSKKSYKAYEKALKINPDYIYVLNNYAYYLSQEGKKLKKAYAMSKKTVEAEPDNSTYLDTFGWILYLQGKPLEAKPFFKHAMLYGGKESPVVMDHYAEVLYALKEYDLAFLYWNMALQKNNGDIPDLEEKVAARKAAAGK